MPSPLLPCSPLHSPATAATAATAAGAAQSIFIGAFVSTVPFLILYAIGVAILVPSLLLVDSPRRQFQAIQSGRKGLYLLLALLFLFVIFLYGVALRSYYLFFVIFFLFLIVWGLYLAAAMPGFRWAAQLARI